MVFTSIYNYQQERTGLADSAAASGGAIHGGTFARKK